MEQREVFIAQSAQMNLGTGWTQEGCASFSFNNPIDWQIISEYVYNWSMSAVRAAIYCFYDPN